MDGINKITAAIVAIMMVMAPASVIIANVFVNDYSAAEGVQCDTIEELEAELANDSTSNIVITADLIITSTIDVKGTHVITSMRDVTITRGASFTGIMFNVNGGAKLTIGDDTGNNVTIDGNKDNVDAKNTMILVNAGASLVLNESAVLTNNNNVATKDEGNGGAVRVEGSKSTLTINGATISNNVAKNAGAVRLNAGSYCEMNGGSVIGNYAVGAVSNENGGNGGAFVVTGGTFVMNEGSISGNHSVMRSGSEGGGDGAAVYLFNDGVASAFTMNGGTIENNVATGINGVGGSGDAIYSKDSGSKVQITGGTVSSDAADGVAVYIAGLSQIIVGGNADISGISVKDSGYLTNAGGTFVIGEYTDGSGNVLKNVTSSVIDANADYGKTFYISANGSDLNTGNDESKPVRTLERLYASIRTSGETDVTVYVLSKIIIKNGISYTIDNGKLWTSADKSGEPLVDTGANVTFVRDASFTGEFPMFEIYSGSSFTLYNITIDGNNVSTTSADGGAVRVAGTFTMNSGAVIQNCIAKYGGAVRVDFDGASFVMNGGEISGNTAIKSGGAVSVRIGTFTMNGGTIAGNTSEGNSKDIGVGPAIHVFNTGKIVLNGGDITGNTAGNTTVSGHQISVNRNTVPSVEITEKANALGPIYVYTTGSGVAKIEVDSGYKPVFTISTGSNSYSVENNNAVANVGCTTFTVGASVTEKVTTNVGYLVKIYNGENFIGTEYDGSACNSIRNDFMVNGFTVTYTLNGDQVGNVENYVYGDTVDVRSALDQKEGYTISGWSMSGSFTITHNVTIEATSTVLSFNVTWNVDGVKEIVPYKYGTTIVVPAIEDKDGKTGAWVEEIPMTMPANDLEFTVGWTVNKYTVTWNNDGVISTEKYTVGDVLNGPVLSKTGYTGVWKDVPAVMPAKDVTIYASWSVNSYNVTWNNAGSETTVSYEYGAAIATPAVADRTGYIFGGWNNVPATMPANNVTITAIWTPIVYTISFSTHGSDVASIDAAFGTTVAAPAAPTREGYTFMGWDRAFPMTVTGDMTATALWSLNYYEVIYIVDGVTVNSHVYGYGSAINDYVFVKEGYTVSAWDSAVPTTMPASNLIFMATSTVNAPVEPETPEVPVEPEVPAPIEPVAAVIDSSVSEDVINAASTLNGAKVFVNVTDGTLENSTVQFSVGTELSGQKLTMYAYGENGFTEAQTVTVDEEGFATITVSAASSYVLVSEDVDEMQVVGGEMDLTYVAIMGAILGFIGVGAVVLRRH